MKSRLGLGLITCGALLWLGMHFSANRSNVSAAHRQPATAQATPSPASGSWYFTVSGDSRDCGDLIMPKIAKSIQSIRDKTPIAFYWHLGDLRQLLAPDCDMIIPLTGDCKKTPPAWGKFPFDYYLTHAWDDFIQHQIEPFDDTPFFLGIGNHELYADHTSRDFRLKFQKWLTQSQLYNQQVIDARKGIQAPDLGMTYYHFVMNGVDFIYLDNAGDDKFDGTQIIWFNKVLAADVADASIKTIIVGMHAALPYSTSSGHAMDDTCYGICSGTRVYNMLYQASLSATKKNIYVLASHAHNFQKDIFQTPQHNGQVLPGWIVGTAGASQYLSGAATTADDEFADCWKTKICYGYLLVEVHPDGTINPQFKQVTQEMEPKGNPALSTYCYNKNGAITKNKTPEFNCACGAK
jgi:Calcineurin-like phosphoesterase